MTKKQMNRNRKKFLFTLLPLITVLVLLLDILFLVLPDREASSAENRNLQTLPKVTWHTITSGDFEKNFEDYIADQFPFRNQWISLETTVSRMMGQKESHGIFLAKKGYLIQNFKEGSAENYTKMKDGIIAISRIDPDIATRVLVAPTAISIYSDKLPFGAVTGDENAFIDRLNTDLADTGISFIDIRSSFAAAAGDHQLYYRTDHHWTTEAAYMAYTSYAESAGVENGINYTPMLVSDSFRGTLSASSGFRPGTTDKIYVYEPDTDTDYQVHFLSDKIVRPSLYFTDCLSTRDQYALFFGGNYPEIEIDTASESEKTLLIFKDSYANCFVPFLIPDYSRILMVDPRYYTGDIQTLIASENITDILFLYNADTLASDANIGQLLE